MVAAGAGQGYDYDRKPPGQKNGNQGDLVVDDDIVARQLREAAEKEKDPQLKEKLWQEYWKYKGKKM